MRPDAEQLQFSLGLETVATCYNQALTGMPAYPATADPKTAKALGAFYTDSEIADFLARWAIRGSGDLVVDPSFGGGVFLRSAANRLAALGASPSRQVYGVEVDRKVHTRIVSRLHDEFQIAEGNLILSDFFRVERKELPLFDAVVGNPPFIRYQRFSGSARQRALARCREIGVTLSELSSSWAPFLVCAADLLRDGGRLAMVIPVELTYATYAKPVIAALRRQFGRITIITFRKRLFPDISEDTLLLLAERKGEPYSGVVHYDLPNAGALRDGLVGDGSRLPEAQIQADSLRLGLQFIDQKTRALYTNLTAREDLLLGTHCGIGIGYVTGANDFFHLSEPEAKHWGIPKRHLKAAVLNGRAFAGIEFSDEDLESALAVKNAAFLLHLNGGSVGPEIEAYLKHGKKLGVPDSYKCRSREPWYSVPHVYQPNCFLTYMSGLTPRLVSNPANAVAPNNLHVLRVKAPEINASALSIAWLTSLSQLSAEVEGHALGGGMLKIEPREAARLLVPYVSLDSKEVDRVARKLDTMVREEDFIAAQDFADKVVLRDALGLSQAACDRLRAASRELKQRRTQGYT